MPYFDTVGLISLHKRHEGRESVYLFGEVEFKENGMRVGAWAGRERVC